MFPSGAALWCTVMISYYIVSFFIGLTGGIWLAKCRKIASSPDDFPAMLPEKTECFFYILPNYPALSYREGKTNLLIEKKQERIFYLRVCKC
jgi:hypothetical protein